MISNWLSPCTSGMGLSRGTYPPECISNVMNVIQHHMCAPLHFNIWPGSVIKLSEPLKWLYTAMGTTTPSITVYKYIVGHYSASIVPLYWTKRTDGLFLFPFFWNNTFPYRNINIYKVMPEYLAIVSSKLLYSIIISSYWYSFKWNI